MQFDHDIIVTGSWDRTCLVGNYSDLQIVCHVYVCTCHLHQVWDVVHFSIIAELQGHTERISCLKFDGTTL